MANPFRGEVELRLKGDNDEETVYRLIYDCNTLVEIEEAMGKTVTQLLANGCEAMTGYKFLRMALFQGLQRDRAGKKLTLRQCGDLIGSPQQGVIAEAIMRGMQLALGVKPDKAPADETESEEDDPPPLELAKSRSATGSKCKSKPMPAA